MARHEHTNLLFTFVRVGTALFAAVIPLSINAAEPQAKAEHVPGTAILNRATNHWAFKQVEAPPIPPGSKAALKRIRTPVDNFIFQGLSKQTLTPADEADPAILIRRVFFDLIGLPPTPEEVASFVNDGRPDAYEQLVERLLNSPHYGERWGRHWLDAAGYADSNGYFDADSDRPLAYKYRDYVVRSVNEDKPFDQFVREQIAGDELAGYDTNSDVTAQTEQLLTATHFLRNAPDGTGESDGNPQELRVDRYSVLEGNVQLLGSVFMGMTVQCARCHDHKFEPFSQQEYYQLQAILRPAYDPDHWLLPKQRLITVGTRQERERNAADIERADREIKAAKESLDGLVKPLRKLVIQENLQSVAESERAKIQKALDAKEKDRSKEMKELLKKYEAQVEIKDEILVKRFPEIGLALPKLQQGIAKREREKPAPLPQISALIEGRGTNSAHFILVRGNYGKSGAEVQPGVPAVESRSANRYSLGKCSNGSSGRRLGLANWLTSENNPVVARLTVNRVWQRHFGVGLVPTADNFGVTGAKPSHPELLDYLASELVRNGWKLKPLHRLILNSATYRQSSAYREVAQRLDPDNKWLSRFAMQRLDAECVRDAMLGASGEIDLSMGGPFVAKDKTEEGQYVIAEDKPGARRRSLYLQQRRTTPVTFVDVFDGAKMNPNCVQRTTSTVALQSLALLNSDFSRARSKAFAARLKREASTDNGRVDLAFELGMGRKPTAIERQAAAEFLRSEPLAPEQTGKLTDFCQMIFASNAFLFVE